ncbi:MAG: hypothetical protein AAF216_12450 [Pseudomonadota bacterium]
MAFPVAKALSKAGHTVCAGVSIFSNYFEWSRYVSKSFRHASMEPGTDEPLPAVREWLEDNPVDAIQPVSEAGLRFLTRHRALFEDKATLVMASDEAIRTAGDKPAMFDLCVDQGVALAPFRKVASIADIEAAIDDIDYPFILKPATVDDELFGRKALIMHCEEDYNALFPQWPCNHPNLLLQKYVTGPRHSVIFTADKGELLGAVEVCAARTHEHDGTGYTTYGITVEPTPAVRDGTEKIARELAYSGTGCTQFIVSPNGKDITFMEVNPRVSLARIAYCAGLDHPNLGLAVAFGDDIERPSNAWSITGRDIEYVWTKGDLMLTAKLMKTRQLGLATTVQRLGRIAIDAARCHHAIFDPLDPAPALGTYANKVIAPFRRHSL